MPLGDPMAPGLEWSVAHAPLKGESISGDAHIVRAVPGGVLVAVVDGIGHGEEAALAAERAMQVLATATNLDVISLVRHCHRVLRDTRGVAMSLALLNTEADSMSWLGVGNVAGHVLRSDPNAMPHREDLLTRGGTIGLRLPMLLASVTELKVGDVFALATDGLRPGFSSELPVDAPLDGLAEKLLATHGRETDDALVFVGRYLGAGRASP